MALGAAGYLAADFKAEADGGFSRMRKRIWDLEIGRAHTPWFHWGTTAMVARAVEQFGSAELKDEVLERTLSGDFRLCLGYTEPEGGPMSPPARRARCVTVTAGSSTARRCSRRMRTTPRTSSWSPIPIPDAPKHQSLTMFLVPLGSPGVEIQAPPHRRRRPHQHHVLQRRPHRRQIPDRRGQRRLDCAA